MLFFVSDRVSIAVAYINKVHIAGYFPRMVLLLPSLILLAIMIYNHPSIHWEESNDDGEAHAPVATATEGSVDWQANLQAIQNLMGAM